MVLFLVETLTLVRRLAGVELLQQQVERPGSIPHKGGQFCDRHDVEALTPSLTLPSQSKYAEWGRRPRGCRKIGFDSLDGYVWVLYRRGCDK